MFPVRYELGFHIPEDDILHSHRRENFKSYIIKYIVFSSLIYPNTPREKIGGGGSMASPFLTSTLYAD
jgi:hypothetical protein